MIFRSVQELRPWDKSRSARLWAWSVLVILCIIGRHLLTSIDCVWDYWVSVKTTVAVCEEIYQGSTSPGSTLFEGQRLEGLCGSRPNLTFTLLSTKRHVCLDVLPYVCVAEFCVTFEEISTRWRWGKPESHVARCRRTHSLCRLVGRSTRRSTQESRSSLPSSRRNAQRSGRCVWALLLIILA